MKKIKFPIFLKLLLLFAVFIVIVNLTAGYIAKITLGVEPPVVMNNYVTSLNEYIIKDIGYPPDLRKAETIAREKQLDIRYETNDLVWSSSDRIPPLAELRKEPGFRPGAPEFHMRFRGLPVFATRLKNGYVFITPVKPEENFGKERSILLIIGAISVITLLLYFAIRWIFGPVKIISGDIDEISRGNLKTRIKLNRSDELGRLADSINEMKEKISGMINAKETLLIDVSHELRSPLTRIKLACEFIEDKKIKTKINEDVNELELMIRGLLDTYRKENAGVEIKREDLNLSDLVKDVVGKFGDERLKFSEDNKDVKISADRSGLETVFRNIIDNALKYSEGKDVFVNITGTDGKAMVSVKDKGKGIEKSELEKIFEPFYRTDRSRNKKIQGYGLGLSLVKKILDGHELEYEIISDPESGTEFIIIFPAA